MHSRLELRYILLSAFSRNGSGKARPPDSWSGRLRWGLLTHVAPSTALDSGALRLKGFQRSLDSVGSNQGGTLRRRSKSAIAVQVTTAVPASGGSGSGSQCAVPSLQECTPHLASLDYALCPPPHFTAFPYPPRSTRPALEARYKQQTPERDPPSPSPPRDSRKGHRL